VEVRRAVIVEVHRDDDAVRATDHGHPNPRAARPPFLPRVASSPRRELLAREESWRAENSTTSGVFGPSTRRCCGSVTGLHRPGVCSGAG
jgi:hypothetical protein